MRMLNNEEMMPAITADPVQRGIGQVIPCFNHTAAKYAEKSTFEYAQSSDFDHIGYWFYLKDFVESK